MLMLGYILAAEGKGAVDYSWALLIAGISIAAKFIGDLVITLWKSREVLQGQAQEAAQQAESQAHKAEAQSQRDNEALRNELAKSRHDALVTLIKGVDEKLGATNHRIDGLERRLNELNEEYHRLSMEFEKHRAVHASGVGT